MFKTRRLIFFIIIIIIVSLTSIGLSCFSYFYVGSKFELAEDSYLLNDEMTLGKSFDVTDIKEDMNYTNQWIDGDVDVNIYVNYTNENGTELELADTVLKYDAENKDFITVGIGSGEIEFISKVDKSIVVRFPYKSKFKTLDASELLKANYPSFFDDGVITSLELAAVSKIEISKSKENF